MFDTPGPATATGVYLRFDNLAFTTNFSSRTLGISCGSRTGTAGYGDAIGGQEFLGLIFMQIHNRLPQDRLPAVLDLYAFPVAVDLALAKLTSRP